MTAALRPHERIIAALDVSSLDEARTLCAALRGHVGLAKVGLELFVSEGAAAVRAAQEAGLPVFLDLKLHDIPNTVEQAARAAAKVGARLLTVHAGGGAAMVAAARRGVRAAGTDAPPLVLAVTVLTSLGADDLAAQGVAETAAEHVVRLGRLAMQAGADGLVCSPLEVAALRAALGPDPVLVVPGIRPAGGAVHDQARIATPAAAVAAGADYLVVGRPLREAADPALAADAIGREIAGAAP